MDRAEAIKVLEKELAIETSYGHQRFINAFSLAIAALREQDVTDINDGHKWISVKEPNPITNADRIRAMTDEELRDFLRCDICTNMPRGNKNCDGECDDCVLDWLQQPCGGADHA